MSLTRKGNSLKSTLKGNEQKKKKKKKITIDKRTLQLDRLNYIRIIAQIFNINMHQIEEFQNFSYLTIHCANLQAKEITVN